MSTRLQEAPTSASVPAGLATAEVARLRAEFGPNAIAEEKEHSLARFARHLWAPVPWMLEATVLLQILLGERLVALMIATLLILNVGLDIFQEGRANAALAILKRRLILQVRARRDGTWREVPATDLVPGDVVQLSLGNVVPADLRIASGALLIDQSMLTGESVPVEMGVGDIAYAGGLVRRGEAVAEVRATGTRTYFGRTAELVRIAHVESAEQKVVLGIVRDLTVVNFAIVVLLVGYARIIGLGIAEIISLVLTALLSAVPVALPATFTVAAALGAKTLALKGVLLTRLSALHEAATIDVLCADKTGTLTRNELAISAVRPAQPAYGEEDVLAYASLASSAEGGDPIDAAIRALAAGHKGGAAERFGSVRFTPFDPAVKMAEAFASERGREIRIVKGAPSVVAAIAPLSGSAAADLDSFTQAGFRTIAVAAGPPGAMDMIGLIAFSDSPRADSAGLLAELRSLGVSTVMVTGDAATTAAAVARKIGLLGAVCPPGKIPESVAASDFAVYAGVFPEQKFRLVKAFQRSGHSVGMCGDGANDAPALRQAQMGIAVSTATDVAKAAAGMVLTEPGLGGIVTAIKEGRAAFQRILTYTLTILINKCVTLVVLGVGLVITRHAVLTPLLLALSMLTNDFVTMSRTADRARPAPYPNAWHVRNLVIAAMPLALLKLLYCVGVLAAGWYWLRFSPHQMQTLVFAALVFANQGVMFVLRERVHVWHSQPAPIILLAAVADIVVVSGFAAFGVLMSPLPVAAIALLFLATLGFVLAMDGAKIMVFARLRID
jgi:H+-transporting ATPase